MVCPKCGGKIGVDDIVYTPDNEVYRRKKCKKCKHVFYTMEFEVEDNEMLRSELAKYSRHKRSNRNKKG